MTSARFCDCEGNLLIVVTLMQPLMTHGMLSRDMIFCRTGRGLQKRIETEGEQLGLKCSLHFWGGAWEIEEFFDRLLFSSRPS
jgi:hypothetical protein